MRSMNTTRAILVFFSLFTAQAGLAQAPHAEWRTITTANYRVHFPAEYEEWARHAAARLESVRELVGEEVGFQPEQTIDVVVMDPTARANGSAWPFLGYPRMVLWSTPPGPESVIGHYTDWVELLTIHEQAHLAHLLRPARSPLQRLLGSYLGVGPLTLRSPRWVAEGYATVIEGDLTAAGRPQSDIRAAILRKWAQEGRLPEYRQLDRDTRSYLGMSMAYLVGSAYLEWLREREGPESLRNLWARMSARQRRSFDEAFRGVFDDSPANLYARFRAELIRDALNLEDEIDQTREGELWQDLSWQTGVPAVSPDGESIALVRRAREKPSRLVVWSTGEDLEAIEKREERIEKLLERDPEDVPAVLRRPLPREPEHELVGRDLVDMLTPRWMPDGSILFVRFEPDHEGFFQPDLYRWRPGEGGVERLTVQAGLREPTPISDHEVIAVRHRFGFSQLVRHDLRSGATTELTPRELGRTYGWPRADRSGEQIAFVRHDGERWRLSLMDIGSGVIRDLDLPGGATTVAYPEWHPSGESLYATIGVGGFLDIWEIDPTGGRSPRQVTRSFGASLAPSIGGEGTEMFFLSLGADGLDLRRLDLAELEPLTPLPPEAGAIAALARPEAREVERPVAVELGPSRPYGIGRLEPRVLFGGGRSPSHNTFEAGLRLGDLIGRLDMIVAGSISSGGPEGGSLRAVWRGWPIAIEGHLFRFDQERSAAPDALDGFAAVDEERTGGELLARWDRRWRGGGVEVLGGIVSERREIPDVRLSRNLAFGELTVRRRLQLAPWMIGGSFDGGVAGGEVGGSSWNGWSAEAGVVGGSRRHALGGWYRRGKADASFPGEGFTVGGSPTTLTPHIDHITRVWSPALIEGVVSGENYEGWRAELQTRALPFVPFYESHRAWTGGPKPEWVELAGGRIDLGLDSFPLLRIPGMSISLGVARILQGPREDETKWWLTTRWRL
jgi:hypothetical protein